MIHRNMNIIHVSKIFLLKIDKGKEKRFSRSLASVHANSLGIGRNCYFSPATDSTNGFLTLIRHPVEEKEN